MPMSLYPEKTIPFSNSNIMRNSAAIIIVNLPEIVKTGQSFRPK